MPSATEQTQQQLPPEALKKLPSLIPRKKRSSPSSQAAPETPPLPPTPDLDVLASETPTRRILSPRDHQFFLTSSTYNLVLAFIFSISEACVDTKRSEAAHAQQAPVITGLLLSIDRLSSLIDTYPAEDQGGSRFGNPAFRSFFDAVGTEAPALHKPLGVLDDSWADEAATYLRHAFGSRDRLDYGSGHELNFAMWLLCLNRLGVLPPSTFSAVGLLVFPKYIKLMRKIQSTYYLEPAGSHGVWGLDDFQFLPFLFGAAQLLHHPYIGPRAIHNDLVVEEESNEYVYIDMIRWTVATKTVKGLKWTQPMLDDISGAKSWVKVEQGMRKMFVKEVLGKLPIMQHFLFGSLLQADERMGKDERNSSPVQERPEFVGPHHHTHGDTWGDCCGIKIPSAVAASADARKQRDNELRRIPFD